jgi:hypothetical protein
MTHTIETLKELHEQRFTAMDKATALAADELSRRLDTLNHFHELAREKERTFISRDTFETFGQRVADDVSMLRRESQAAADAAASVRETAIKAVSEGFLEQNTKNEIRFGRIEGVHAKIVGGLVLGTFMLPLITGLLIYLLTKNQ